MPLKSPRYIHVQTPHGKYHGFSVYFYPHDLVHDMVCYTVAMCSKEDFFCKRTAREQCMIAKEHMCRVVDFPRILADLDFKSQGYHGVPGRAYCNMYAWVWKYFL